MGEACAQSRIDPELIIQESTYGIVMALTLILTAQMGIFHYASRTDLILAILGMDFVWGAIDMFIFYRCDVLARYRRLQFSRKMSKMSREEKLLVLEDEFGDTVLEFVDAEDRRRILDSVADSRFNEKTDARCRKKHYTVNAVAAFLINFAGVIPSVLCLWLMADYSQALIGSAAISSLVLFVIAYLLVPSDSGKTKLIAGLTTAGMALLFTVFAALFGG